MTMLNACAPGVAVVNIDVRIYTQMVVVVVDQGQKDRERDSFV
jgi:NCAIR mutase (PurE)-related protein